MALILNEKSKYGVSTLYYKITTITIDNFAKQGFITVCSFMSKEARDEGYSFIDKEYYNVYPKEFDLYFNLDLMKKKNNDIYKLGYLYLKENILKFNIAIND